jgi:DNA-binding NarL/FixJ family response regulator
MQANVTGYIRRTPLDETCIGAVHAVAGGSVVIDQQLAAASVIHLATHPDQPDLKPWQLDALDRSIIARLGQGVSMTELADSVALPPRSLYTRIQRICRKFGVRKRADLLYYTAEFGLLTSGVEVA